jgi:hypothetical protein
MGRIKGGKNRPKQQATVEQKPIVFRDIDTGEISPAEIKSEIDNESLPENLKISDADDSSIMTVKRMSKDERQQQELKQRLDALTDADYMECKFFIDGIFNIVAIKAGDKWKLTEDESKMLSRPMTRVIAKYVGADTLKYADEIGLALAVVSIIGIRLKPNDTTKTA